MLKIRKSVLGAAMLASLAAAVAAPMHPADARPILAPRGHWVHGWHDGRFGWWWAGPNVWYWYPAPVYSDFGPPPPAYMAPPVPAPQANWYYCDSAKGYYPAVQSCSSGWRAVAANPQGQNLSAQPPASPPPPASSKS